MNSKANHTGPLATMLNAEIAAGFKRLGIRSPAELRAESNLYPWVAENPDFYEILPEAAGARARAVELLDFLVFDGFGFNAHIPELDNAITELRTVLQNAAAKPLPVVAAKAAKHLRDAMAA